MNCPSLLRASGLGIALFASLGCYESTDLEGDPEVSPGAAQHEAACLPYPGEVMPPSLHCLDFRAPYNFDPDASEYVLSTQFTELLNGEGVEEAQVAACRFSDVDCAEPYDEASTSWGGDFSIAMPGSAEHYLTVHHADFPEHLIYFGGLPRGFGYNGSYGSYLPLINARNLHNFVELITGDDAIPGRGHVGAEVEDCSNAVTSGVTMTIDTADELTATSYLDEAGLPDCRRRSTSSAGRVAVANVPSGPATAVFRDAETGRIIATRRFRVREGAVTILQRVGAGS